MTEQEFKDYLKSIHSFINVAKGAINKESKEVQDFISFYTKLTGKKVGEGSCKDCILDAYFELSTKTPNQLKILLMEKSYSLKKNKVVGFGGSHYTKDNMTDAVAFEMVRSNRSNAAHFENPEQLLKDYDGQIKLSVHSSENETPIYKSGVGIETEKKEEERATAPAPDAKIEVKITEKKKGRPAKK